MRRNRLSPPAGLRLLPAPFAVALVLLLLPGITMAQSRWEATLNDGSWYPEVYRLNGTTDTLFSAPAEGRPWRQFHLSDVAELRKVYSDAWWYLPVATVGIGAGVVIIEGRPLTDPLIGAVSVLLVGAATGVAAGTAAILAKDEVHDLQSMTPEEAEMMVGARIPIAFGSRAEGITRFDPATPPGRRISPVSWWGGFGVGALTWSDGFRSTTRNFVGSYWDHEHLLTLRYRSAEDLSVTRGTIALLYGRAISLERTHASVSAGLAYEYSEFDSTGLADAPYHPLYRTAGVVIDGEFVWPVSSWFGVGLAANAGFSFKGAYGGLMLSMLFGDLE